MTLQTKLIKLEQRIQAKMPVEENSATRVLRLIILLYEHECRGEPLTQVPVDLKVTRKGLDMLTVELFGDVTTRSDEDKQTSQGFTDKAVTAFDNVGAWLG